LLVAIPQGVVDGVFKAGYVVRELGGRPMFDELPVLRLPGSGASPGFEVGPLYSPQGSDRGRVRLALEARQEIAVGHGRGVAGRVEGKPQPLRLLLEPAELGLYGDQTARQDCPSRARRTGKQPGLKGQRISDKQVILGQTSKAPAGKRPSRTASRNGCRVGPFQTT
jgi:hypothetical protein